MIKRKILKKKIKGYSVYYIILSSYMAMILTFIVTGVILMRQSETALTMEVVAANRASMHQMRNLIDDGLRSIERLCYEQSLNTKISGLIYTQRRASSQPERNRRMTVVDVIHDMHSASIANDFVDILYLMTFYDKDVLTQYGKYSLDEFFQTHYSRQDKINLDDFLKLNTQTVYKQYVTIPTGKAGSRDILFMYALPINTREKLAVLGVHVSGDTVRDIIKSSEWLPDAQIVLLDQNGEIIVTGNDDGEELNAGQVHWNEIESDQPFQISIENKKYTVMAVDSNASPYRYGVVVPSSVFLLPQQNHIKAYSLGLTLMLVVGVAMAVLMAYMQYRPIRQLANSIILSNMQPGMDANEYQLIKRGISNIKTENTVLSHMNRQQLKLLHSQRLISVLHGMPIDEYELKDILRDNGMPMRHERYCFMLISHWDSEGSCVEASVAGREVNTHLPSEENDTVTAENRCGIKDYVKHFAADLLPDVEVLSIDNGQVQYFLINIPDSISEPEVLRCCENLAEISLCGNCIISIGRLFTELSEIHQEFLLVSEIRELQLTGQHKRVMSVSMLPDNDSPLQTESCKLNKEVIVAESVALIQERYTDQMLSVASIADELGVSQVALTRAFKRVLNIGALDFIQKTRLGIAKQLIANTNTNLLEIAQQVGYGSNVTFIRVFKKHEGITPSQYRAMSARYEDSES